MNDPFTTLALGTAPVATLAPAAGLGVVVGAASMLLYGRLSPQPLLAEVGARTAEARAELMRFDGGDVRVVWALTRRAIGLSFRQIGLVIGPTAAAVLPVIAVAWLADDWLASSRGPGSAEAAWWASGHAAFWASLCVSALVVKLRFGIK